MSNKKGPSSADLPRESKITDTEYYIQSHSEEIVNFMEKKTPLDIAPTGTGDAFDGLLNRLINEFPFGKLEAGGFYYDKFHAILANALMSSFWCGWLSQALVNKKEPKFKAEYLEQFQRLMTEAFDIGRRYASQRP
jgi:pyridoxal/pyridoxine/pyridoxamine kinase